MQLLLKLIMAVHCWKAAETDTARHTVVFCPKIVSSFAVPEELRAVCDDMENATSLNARFSTLEQLKNITNMLV